MSAPGRVRRAVVAGRGLVHLSRRGPAIPAGAGAFAAAASAWTSQRFLRIPVHVLVGDRDVGRGPSLRTGPSIDRRQGVNRIARALRWTDHLEDVARARNLAPRVSFDLLADTGHCFTEAVERGGLVAQDSSTSSARRPLARRTDGAEGAMTRDQRLVAAFATLAVLAPRRRRGRHGVPAPDARARRTTRTCRSARTDIHPAVRRGHVPGRPGAEPDRPTGHRLRLAVRRGPVLDHGRRLRDRRGRHADQHRHRAVRPAQSATPTARDRRPRAPWRGPGSTPSNSPTTTSTTPDPSVWPTRSRTSTRRASPRSAPARTWPARSSRWCCAPRSGPSASSAMGESFGDRAAEMRGERW